MALVHTNTTVGTIATLICQVPNGIGYTAINIYNNDTSSIFIGDANITVTAGSNQGTPITSRGATLQLWLHGGDKLYAISAAGTTAGAVSVIYSGE